MDSHELDHSFFKDLLRISESMCQSTHLQKLGTTRKAFGQALVSAGGRERWREDLTLRDGEVRKDVTRNPKNSRHEYGHAGVLTCMAGQFHAALL